MSVHNNGFDGSNSIWTHFDAFCIFQFCIHPRSVPHVFHVRFMHPRFESTRRFASPQTLATSVRAPLSLVPAPLFHASSNGRMGSAHSPRLAPRRLLLVPSGSLNCVGCSVLGRGAEPPQFWVLLIWLEPGISHVTWVHYDATMCLPCFVCSILPVLHFLRFDLCVL